MNWLSLIPVGLSILGGLTSGGQKTDTTSTQSPLSPLVEGLGKQALNRASSVFSRPYQQYTGERVAGPTAARTQLGNVMSGIQSKVAAGNGLQPQLKAIMSRPANRITAPTLVPQQKPMGM